MATKRQFEGGTSDSEEPQAKRPTAILPAVSIGPISSLEEMDIKMLQFQNKKLWEKIEIRRQAETELTEQVETLQAKQTATEATLSLVNRYWDQLDENIKVVLQRLGSIESKCNENETDDDDDIKKKSFHRMLRDKDFQDIKDSVASRLEFTRQYFVRVVDAIITVEQENTVFAQIIGNSDSIEPAVKKRNKELEENNGILLHLTTQLEAAHDKFTIERSSLEEEIEALEERVEELQETAENARWELKKTRLREDRLTRRLAEALEKLSREETAGQTGNTNAATTSQETSQKNAERSPSDEDQQIAESRLAELEKMKLQHQEALKEVEKLKTNLKNIPESLIFQSSEYKTLKSQFSVLYNESVQMKQVLDDTRTMLQLTRNNHLRRIEQLECDELQSQRKLRNEMIQLEDTLAKVRHDYEALHAELEQNLAANEQAGPVNREMRHLINSLQNHNRQLKGEIQRYKKKMKDLQTELAKSKQEGIHRLQAEIAEESGKNAAAPPIADKPSPSKERVEGVDHRKGDVSDEKGTFSKQDREELIEKLEKSEENLRVATEKLKSSENQIKELKLLLDMYKSMSKEQRDKAEIMASERDARSRFSEMEEEISALKIQLVKEEEERRMLKKELEDKVEEFEELARITNAEKERADRAEQRERAKQRGPDADTVRKMKVLEETIAEQRRNLAATKQEEEALLSEMDVTGQAFEDMQEQNMRLLQQLREKDDANFKLMSERIKANQIQKLLQEEKSVLQDQAETLHTQVDNQNKVVRLLEEKERGLQNQLMAMEKEVILRTQAVELHKRKAVEMSQSTEDMRRELEKQQRKTATLEEQINEKVEKLEEEHFKLSRMQEDGARLRKKLEKHKKTEGFYNADEILMEEIKEYKTKLRCPCCNVNNKDAVLTKCFHVFCIKCIKTRYETRQRKCPKCNAAFGGNDFHRIYIE